MPKNKRPKWQQLGFRTYAEYQKHLKTTSRANTTKAKVADMLQEYIQEAVNKESFKQQQHQEAETRLKYHNLRLQGL